jgi:hypothetical protein
MSEFRQWSKGHAELVNNSLILLGMGFSEQLAIFFLAFGDN